MFEESKLKADDPDNPQKALARLKNPKRAAEVRGKIIKIPADRTKFVCPNHRVKMVIEMKESAQRDKNNKLEEFECSCGVIYVKE